jgi:CDP-diacylglycerol--glycerol-3-phosphate 3-phosphatidyltransferase
MERVPVRDGPAAQALGRPRLIYFDGVFELNVPNALTVFRMLLVPVLAALLLSEGPEGDYLAAAVFCLASLTDALDGWIARRQRSITNFGKLMDPLADKLLVTAALVSLVAMNRVAAWVAMVIIAREFAVTGLRLIAMEQGGHVIPASSLGKAKTTTQVAMVLALILVDGSPLALDVLVVATVAVTVASGADYFFGLRRVLATDPPRPADARIET